MSDNKRAFGMAMVMHVLLLMFFIITLGLEQTETAIDPTGFASISLRFVVIIAAFAQTIIPCSIVLYFDWWME